MKINSIKMSNFGLYAGEDNFLDFTATSLDKPIILVGGANGRGKTTILEAILLCLYGNRSYAFLESTPLTYPQYIEKFINRTNRNKTTSLELSISAFFEGENSSITIKRDWEEKEKGLQDTFTVFRNGEFDRFLTDDWDNQIEHIMPVSLSKFFLFDGERVAELMQDDSDSKIANSIKILFGLDAIEQLDLDLKTITTKNKTYKEMEKNDAELRQLHQEKDDTDEKIKVIALRQSAIQQDLIEQKKKLVEVEEKFSKKKGNLFANRNKVSSIKNETEKEQKEIESQIYERVAGFLPLMLVKNLIQQSLHSVELQERQRQESQEILGIERFLQQLDNIPQNIADAFENKRRRIEENMNIDNFHVSALVLEQLRFLSSCNEAVEMQAMTDMFTRRNVGANSLGVDSLYLETEIDSKGMQSLVDKIVSINKMIARLESDDEKLSAEMSDLRRKSDGIDRQLNDIMLKYIDSGETKDSAKRLLSYSVKIKKVLSEYKRSVKELKISTLSQIVTEKFKAIIGKKSLVNEIIFDKETLVMSLYNSAKQEVFRRQLSAGEKQLLSTAIIWGIIECSGQSFPMTIDTPLARLDHAHRNLFTKNYLPKAGQQVIIFSTDAEVVDSLEEKIERYVAKKYLLEYSEEEKYTKIIEGRYF